MLSLLPQTMQLESAQDYSRQNFDQFAPDNLRQQKQISRFLSFCKCFSMLFQGQQSWSESQTRYTTCVGMSHTFILRKKRRSVASKSALVQRHATRGFGAALGHWEFADQPHSPETLHCTSQGLYDHWYNGFPFSWKALWTKG